MALDRAGRGWRDCRAPAPGALHSSARRRGQVYGQRSAPSASSRRAGRWRLVATRPRSNAGGGTSAPNIQRLNLRLLYGQLQSPEYGSTPYRTGLDTWKPGTTRGKTMRSKLVPARSQPSTDERVYSAPSSQRPRRSRRAAGPGPSPRSRNTSLRQATRERRAPLPAKPHLGRRLPPPRLHVTPAALMTADADRPWRQPDRRALLVHAAARAVDEHRGAPRGP